jgi:hypothetical protein
MGLIAKSSSSSASSKNLVKPRVVVSHGPPVKVKTSSNRQKADPSKGVSNPSISSASFSSAESVCAGEDISFLQDLSAKRKVQEAVIDDLFKEGEIDEDDQLRMKAKLRREYDATKKQRIG